MARLVTVGRGGVVRGRRVSLWKSREEARKETIYI